MGERQDWIVGIGGNDLNSVNLMLYKDRTPDEMKQVLANLVVFAHSNDCHNRHGCRDDFKTCKDYATCDCYMYQGGSDTAKDIEEASDGTLYGYANFLDYHLDYMASPLSIVQVIERK